MSERRARRSLRVRCAILLLLRASGARAASPREVRLIGAGEWRRRLGWAELDVMDRGQKKQSVELASRVSSMSSRAQLFSRRACSDELAEPGAQALGRIGSRSPGAQLIVEWERRPPVRSCFDEGSSCSDELAEPRCAGSWSNRLAEPRCAAHSRMGAQTPGAQFMVESARRAPARSSWSNRLAEPRRAVHGRIGSQSPGAQFMVESARRAPLRSSARGAAHHSSEWERPLRRSRSFEPARLGRGVPKKDPMCGGLARTGRERLLRSR